MVVFLKFLFKHCVQVKNWEFETHLLIMIFLVSKLVKHRNYNCLVVNNVSKVINQAVGNCTMVSRQFQGAEKTQSYDFKTKFQEEPTVGITTTQLILITFSKTQPRLISKGGPKQSRRAENDSDGTISSEEFHASSLFVLFITQHICRQNHFEVAF